MSDMTSWFVARIASFGDQPAMTHGDETISYEQLASQIGAAHLSVQSAGIQRGSVVGFTGDFSPGGVALFFGLALAGAIIVPLGQNPPNEVTRLLLLGEVEWLIRPNRDQAKASIKKTGRRADHPLLRDLAATGNAGLILFSSGSSGPPKAALHDIETLFEKFQSPRPAMRTAGFLLFDHIGGLNTLWHVLSNGGFFACLPNRSGDAVAAAITRHDLEVLPTSPTFVNLLVLSGALERYPMPTLRVITYGTEPMPEATLRRIHERLPSVELRQTYGLSELGILRAKSENSASLLVKIGGPGYETRVVNGVLHIRAQSAMRGYLNAPSPFDADGWFNTNDLVEVHGDYVRILGRASEVINVGGQKVHPSEVESVVLELLEVAQVVVNGQPNPILGQVVVAQVVPAIPIDPAELRSRVRTHCRRRLAAFKVPVKVIVDDTPLHSARFKKLVPSAR